MINFLRGFVLGITVWSLFYLTIYVATLLIADVWFSVKNKYE